MVDRERLADLLAALTEALDDLRRYRGSVTAEDLHADRDKRNMVLHALRVAVQSAIDAAQHLVADKGLPRPDTYRQSFEILGSAGLVDRDLADRLADLAGFRNVLVHIYRALDLDRVHQILVTDSLALADFQAKVRELLRSE